jgi:hypothetical protein
MLMAPLRRIEGLRRQIGMLLRDRPHPSRLGALANQSLCLFHPDLDDLRAKVLFVGPRDGSEFNSGSLEIIVVLQFYENTSIQIWGYIENPRFPLDSVTFIL